jgi:SAM-dependent methyltransferase
MPVYDTIGTSYAATRRPDPRIGAQIAAALSGCRSVINVGAGAGAYEPPQTILAADLSMVMIRQRPPGSALAVQARAENLPVTDDAADAVMAVLTVHHWDDLETGIGELRRIARRRVVILTWDPRLTRRFWLLADYLPQAAAFDNARAVSLDRITSLLGTVRTEPVLIPHDCTDGFAAAYWRRPRAYLDPAVRAGISVLAQPGEDVLQPGLQNLAADLDSGRWYERHSDLMRLNQLDAGYRLLVAELRQVS